MLLLNRQKDSNSMRLIWDKIRGTGRDQNERENNSTKEDNDDIIEDVCNGNLAQSFDNEDVVANDDFSSDESVVESSEDFLGGFNDWGANRLDEDNINKSRGFPWTANELEIVRQWKVQNPRGSIKYCLEAIYANEDFRKEFHIHHAINTGRLLTAWKKF